MNDAVGQVHRYHQATKHRLRAYAPGPAFLDWDSQPDPFRRFEGAPLVALPLREGPGHCAYDDLYRVAQVPPAALSIEGLGLMFELALGLSAWKSSGVDRWALRNNPSSGNLHPTEGYLLLWQAADPALPPGLYHYAPHEHALERRALLPPPAAAALAASRPGTFGALGLASVLWREEWKYGARALRYCQHDVGHALAAARLAAAVLGWRLRVDVGAADAQIAAGLGLDRDDDFAGAESEHPDLIAIVGGSEVETARVDWGQLAAQLQDWSGRANRLSDERVRWPQIAAVLSALERGEGGVPRIGSPPTRVAEIAGDPVAADACTLIRRRRSAQRMDGTSRMARARFERALYRTLPDLGGAPFDAFTYPPAVNLVLFVHAVDGLDPGLYLLLRAPSSLQDLRAVCASPALDWQPLDDTALPLYRLKAPLELRAAAAQLSCHQAIAGRGAFAVAMLADLAGVIAREGAWAYRRLYWEAGMIGQVLYLEAEAAGLRGTGIGCYFDDEVHRLLGIDTQGVAAWQDLYHFTVGGAVDDQRLSTEPPYAHLAAGA